MIRTSIALVWLAWRQVWGTPVRSCLTVLAVAAGMAVVTAVVSLDQAMRRALDDGQQRLVVMQAHRHCPLTSWIPLHLASETTTIAGVAGVRPVRVIPSHCGTALDVMVLRGVPADNPGDDLELVAGSWYDWRERTDAAAVGVAAARRRGLGLGDTLSVGGLTLVVTTIIQGPSAIDHEHIRVPLEHLQRALPGRGEGLVTAFEVQLEAHAQAADVAQAIDQHHASLGIATSSRSNRAAMAAAARDLLTLTQATRYLALAAALAVALLVANALILGLRARRRSMAVLAAVGFSGSQRALLVISESCLLAATGAALGVGGMAFLMWWHPPGIASEGWSLHLRGDRGMVFTFIAGIGLGLAAAALPAYQAARMQLAHLLRNAGAAV